MEAETTRRRLSEQLQDLVKLCSIRGCNLQIIMDQVGFKGHSLFTALLSLVFFIPIPLPGISIPFGILIFLLGIRMAWGSPPHIPEWIAKKNFPAEKVGKGLVWVAKWMRVLEKMIRPRGRVFVRLPLVYRLNGCMIALGGLLLALPLPPGTNFPPALGIFILSVGMIEEDGLFVLIGNLVLITILSLFISILFFSFQI